MFAAFCPVFLPVISGSFLPVFPERGVIRARTPFNFDVPDYGCTTDVVKDVGFLLTFSISPFTHESPIIPTES